jgi:hypothetical protein
MWNEKAAIIDAKSEGDGECEYSTVMSSEDVCDCDKYARANTV